MSDARRHVVLTDDALRTAPLDVTVSIYGDDHQIVSLVFDRAWAYMSFGMSRADLERVSRALSEVLEATSDDRRSGAMSPVTREDFLRGIGESDHPEPF
jgi:hypothetical protein